MAVLLNLTEFPGANTNNPKGTVPATDLLLNVNMDRTGGYTGMPARSRRLESVTRALAANRSDNLFVETGGSVKYWRASDGTLNAITNGPATLDNAVPLMMGTFLQGDRIYTHETLVNPVPTAVTTQITTTVISDFTGVVNPPPPLKHQAGPYDVYVQVAPVPGGPFTGSTEFTDLGAGLTSDYVIVVNWPAANPMTVPHLKVFIKGAYETEWKFAGTNQMPDGTLAEQVGITAGPSITSWGRHTNTTPAPTDGITFSTDGNTASVYHRGRVFLAPYSATYTLVAGRTAPEVVTDTEPTRIYYSQVIASASTKGWPAFTLVNYFDAPFRVSRRVVAMASVGAYLYIFGDRELLVMTGDPEFDPNIENIGDSIGAVSGGSVRQLSGVVYWQSDSGVLAVQGGQVMEVGGPVRDQLIALGLNVTATVDFKREQYILTDGATILVYHAREKAWTTRQVESGGTPSLIYGGGTPYMVQGTTLYSIGGEPGLDGAPNRLDFTVRFPPLELGDWRAGKSFEGITFGMDLATQGATVTHRSTVDGRTDQTADTHQAITAGKPGAVKVRPHRDGIGLTGAVIAMEFKVSTQDSRGIMRPPLMLHGTVTGEMPWEDDQDGV